MASLENGLLRFVIFLMALCSPLASASSYAPARAMHGSHPDSHGETHGAPEPEPAPAPEPEAKEEKEASTAPASEVRVEVGESSTFGPGNCVSLSRTKLGTCMLSTKCASQNISDTEFSFVCFNPNTSLPHALHSFGRGGFEPEEQFDTGVRCRSCATVSLAFETGGPLVQNALKSLPSSVLPESSLPITTVEPEATDSTSEPSSEPKTAVRIPEKSSFETAPNGTVFRTMKPAEASYYGPESCVAAFRAPSGTCVIETRCEEEALANFNMGVTCVDKTGSSAKYLFGKGIFKADEIFDTRLQCEACLGVGEDVNKDKLTGYMPKQLIEDVNSLKEQMKQLSEQLRALGGENATSDEESNASKKEKEEKEGKEEGFDCEAGVDKWQDGWSDAKKEFCCKTMGTGCKLFNCSVAVDEWERGWSETKKEFCCKDTGVGCKENTLKAEVEEPVKKEEAKGGKIVSEKTTTPSESTPSPATEEEDLAPAPSLASAPATKTGASSSSEDAGSEELAKASVAPGPAPEIVPAEKKESSLVDQDTPVILHHRQQGQAIPALKDFFRLAAFRNQN